MSKTKAPQAVGEYLILEPPAKPEEDIVKGIVLLPEAQEELKDEDRQDAIETTVLTVGESCKIKVKPGDKVLVLNGSCLQTIRDEVQYLLCKESRVVAVL